MYYYFLKQLYNYTDIEYFRKIKEKEMFPRFFQYNIIMFLKCYFLLIL